MKRKSQSFPKFTIAQMNTAYENVRNRKGWGHTIKATFPNPGYENLRCLSAAINLFTGSNAFFMFNGADDTVTVTSKRIATFN